MPQIKIAGVEGFEVPAPYAEGHTLTATEASALNGLLAENLRNNFAPKVKAAQEKGEVDVAALQAELTAYASEYAFGVRRAGGGGGGLPADPVEREAVKMAREMVRQAIKARGAKPEQEQVNQLADQLLAQNADIRKEAKRRVNATKNMAVDFATLGASGGAEGEAEAE